MEKRRGMERDHSFCGSMSTTRSHSRNQDPPQWDEGFVSTAAHFSAVSVAVIMEIGQLKMPQWFSLPEAAIHSATNSPFPDTSLLRQRKIQKARKLKTQHMKNPKLMASDNAL